MKIARSTTDIVQKVVLFFVFFGCGSIPNEPATDEELFEIQPPLLSLPEAFQEIPLTTVRSKTLENTFFGTYYAPPQGAQYFEYKGGFISGHILKYGDPLEARIQHRNAMSTLNLDGVERSSPNNTHTLWEGQRPHTYLYVDSCAVHFTLDTQQLGYTYDPSNHDQQLFIKEKSKEFSRQVRTQNRPSTPTPFYVELKFARELLQPPLETRLIPGQKIPFHTTLNYILTDSDAGQITIRIRQENTKTLTEKIIPITRGRGSIAYSDTLHPSNNIPQSGTVISITAKLSPPYTGHESPSIIRYSQQVERLPNDQWAISAFDSISYVVP